MSDFFNDSDPGITDERRSKLEKLVVAYLGVSEVVSLDTAGSEAHMISHIAGRLREEGNDPDEVFKEFGIIEENDEI